MKFTKRILIMTALAVTAVVSTGFAYDYGKYDKSL